MIGSGVLVTGADESELELPTDDDGDVLTAVPAVPAVPVEHPVSGVATIATSASPDAQVNLALLLPAADRVRRKYDTVSPHQWPGIWLMPKRALRTS